MTIAFFHPADRDLVGLATGDLSDTTQSRLSGHLVSCQRCRSYVQDVRAMAMGATATNAPRASDMFLVRILAERSAGAQVILATSDVETEPHTRIISWRVLAPVGLAAVLAFSMLSVWHTHTRATSAQPIASRAQATSASTFTDMLSIWPSVASAQTPVGSREAPYPPVRVTGSMRLKTESYQYVFSSSIAPESLQVRPSALISEAVEQTTFRGTPAWRLTASSGAYPGGSQRTVLLASTDLHLLESRWETGNFVQLIHVTDSSVIVRFSPKPGAYPSQYNAIPARSGEFPRQPGRPLVIGDAALRFLFRGLPLHTDWRGSIDVISNASPLITQIRPMYVNLRVTNQVWVASSRRHILCWRVLVDAGGSPEYWYVSRSSGELIRSERQNEDGSRVAVDRIDPLP